MHEWQTERAGRRGGGGTAEGVLAAGPRPACRDGRVCLRPWRRACCLAAHASAAATPQRAQRTCCPNRCHEHPEHPLPTLPAPQVRRGDDGRPAGLAGRPHPPQPPLLRRVRRPVGQLHLEGGHARQGGGRGAARPAGGGGPAGEGARAGHGGRGRQRGCRRVHRVGGGVQAAGHRWEAVAWVGKKSPGAPSGLPSRLLTPADRAALLWVPPLLPPPGRHTCSRHVHGCGLLWARDLWRRRLWVRQRAACLPGAGAFWWAGRVQLEGVGEAQLAQGLLGGWLQLGGGQAQMTTRMRACT